MALDQWICSLSSRKGARVLSFYIYICAEKRETYRSSRFFVNDFSWYVFSTRFPGNFCTETIYILRGVNPQSPFRVFISPHPSSLSLSSWLSFAVAFSLSLFLPTIAPLFLPGTPARTNHRGILNERFDPVRWGCNALRVSARHQRTRGPEFLMMLLSGSSSISASHRTFPCPLSKQGLSSIPIWLRDRGCVGNSLKPTHGVSPRWQSHGQSSGVKFC